MLPSGPVAHVELDPVRKPKALVWTVERVAKWQQTGEKTSPVMVWTPEQTGAFLDFVAEDRLYAMWHLIASRGLRRDEACRQPWSETNLDAVASELIQDGWEAELGLLVGRGLGFRLAKELDQQPIRSRIAHASHPTAPLPCDASRPEQHKTPGQRVPDLGFF